MKVWVLHTYGSGVGSDVMLEVYATWEKAYARWRGLREDDSENTDVDDEDMWEEYASERDQYAKYSYDSDDGWVHVEVQKCDVQGLEGRNKL